VTVSPERTPEGADEAASPPDPGYLHPAWETQDPGLIVTIFTSSAIYHERVLEDPIPGREAIRHY
jgi:hypothetical protein